MAIIVDGRILVNKKRKSGIGSGFYGSTVKNITDSGFIKQEDRKDLAKLVNDSFAESSQYAKDINFAGLQVIANEAAAVTAGLETGMLYQTATGEVRIKL